MEGTEPLISVIIPVYNAQQYISRCLDSICRQTYHNLEMIAVDDGSVDGSKAMLDRLSQRDARIRIIHQPNKGPAAARNTGVRAASGEFVLFVDSDDWIYPNHVQHLYQMAKETRIDICSSAFRISSDPRYSLEQSQQSKAKLRVEDSAEAMRSLLYSTHLNHSPWGKLYRRELFSGICYPEGYLYEDLFTTWRLFEKARFVASSDAVTYCYFVRPGSIVHGTLERKHLVGYEAIAQIASALGPEYDPAIRTLYLVRSMEYMRQAHPRQRKLQREIWSYVRKNRKGVFWDRNASRRIRVFALLSYTGRVVTKKVVDGYDFVQSIREAKGKKEGIQWIK